jgi:hypothetical protein
MLDHDCERLPVLKDYNRGALLYSLDDGPEGGA